jgi:hypothetical protein
VGVVVVVVVVVVVGDVVVVATVVVGCVFVADRQSRLFGWHDLEAAVDVPRPIAKRAMSARYCGI